MKIIHCDTAEQLKLAIASFGSDALFRGQVAHYQRADGSLSLPTSFQRHGCIPPLMLKWTHYAKKALERHVDGWSDAGDPATDQAILQHYGWRSFFVDATGDSRVAAWFASQEFVSHRSAEMVEDCFENPVYLRCDQASYKESSDSGHIYVISRRKLRAAGLEAIHLSEIATRDGAPRYVRQDAYMIGSLYDGYLDPSLVVAHISAPADVLRAHAGSMNTAWLFPEPEDDPIFSELLAMPWEKIGTMGGGIDAFARSLPIPEYQPHLRKIMPPESAFHRPFWISDLSPPPGQQGQPRRQVHIRCGSAAYHGSAPVPNLLRQIMRLLEESDEVIIETDALVYHGMGTTYGKGIAVIKTSDDLLEVFEFGVDHPGLRLERAARFPGLFYSVDVNGVWHRKIHAEDCSCGDPHEGNLRILGIVNELLEDGSIRLSEPGLYLDPSLVIETDPAVTKSWEERRLQ
ncbi:hypothetical protein IB223_14655 [Pseudoxanthomonas sp. PXM03]|uniref:hypothetical protein n=1 Tax=Pseudoxanthomonas sp. PXM03 TaxID=2769284 RepID=UPI00177CD80B|nr:hypothetical protein [Pseudoxanthomonas sp. PXM03]MBD9437341.1 hypothetical protein [Pseudoxanthomonas sp. PXM03]